MYSKESVFSMIVLLFFFISDTYSFQVERNQTGDIILDAKTADVCLRINRTEWKNNACRCKQDFTTFHAPTRNIFGCMSREEISTCEGRSLTSNLKEADIIEVSLKGQLQLTTACNNTSNLTVFAEVFRADDWTEIALQVAFSEPDKIILNDSRRDLNGSLLRISLIDYCHNNICVIVKLPGAVNFSMLNTGAFTATVSTMTPEKIQTTTTDPVPSSTVTTSAANTTPSVSKMEDSEMSTELVLGILAGVLVLVLLASILVLKRRKTKKKARKASIKYVFNRSQKMAKTPDCKNCYKTDIPKEADTSATANNNASFEDHVTIDVRKENENPVKSN